MKEKCEAHRTAGRAAMCRSGAHLMTSMYSTSLPLLSRHLRYMTDASTLAGEKVLGSFSSEMTLSRMVLRGETEGGSEGGLKTHPRREKQEGGGGTGGRGRKRR